MVTTIEVKKEYKCDLCSTTQISTDELPTGWIVVHGFEPDDSRPSPTMHLCPSCTVRTFRAIAKNPILRELISRTEKEILITNDRLNDYLIQASQNTESYEDHEDADSMWLRRYEEDY